MGHRPPSPQAAEQEVMTGQRHGVTCSRPHSTRPCRWRRVLDEWGLCLEGGSDGLRVPVPSTEPGSVRVYRVTDRRPPGLAPCTAHPRGRSRCSSKEELPGALCVLAQGLSVDRHRA